MLLLIRVSLPVPIPLGYGFFFSGAGGLLGIIRGIDLDRLRIGLRSGTADSILFPTDIIRRIDTTKGTISIVAGIGPKGRGFSGDGGPALEAKMDRPHGIAIDPAGVLYIGDTNNHRERRVGP